MLLAGVFQPTVDVALDPTRSGIALFAGFLAGNFIVKLAPAGQGDVIAIDAAFGDIIFQTIEIISEIGVSVEQFVEGVAKTFCDCSASSQALMALRWAAMIQPSTAP
jgi:hypothetical protein